MQGTLSYFLADKIELPAYRVFDHWGWILMFIIGNGLLGELDERNLEKAGLNIKAAPILSAILMPVYIYVIPKAMASDSRSFRSGG